MRRTISGVAIAVLASATLLAGCGGDTAETDTVDPAADPAVEDTMEPMDDATMEDMATMEPTDG